MVAVGPMTGRAQGPQTSPPQGPPTPPTQNVPQTTAIAAFIASAKPDVPESLTLANREITVLRASILGRGSADRVRIAQALLSAFASASGQGRAEVRMVDGAAIFSVDGREAFLILPADVDALAGETLDGKAQLALSRLQLALNEVREGESAGALAWGAAQSAAVTIVFVVIVIVLRRIDVALTKWLAAATEFRLSASLQLPAAVVRRSRVIHYAQRAVDFATLVVVLMIGYVWLAFVLRRFPYSRPWGDAIRGFLVDRLEWLANGLVDAIPGLATVVLVVFVTRILQHLLNQLFLSAEMGQLRLPALYPETIAPTRRIASLLLWLFALIVAYPFLPGSGTDAFKGVSVFLGLVISLGSTGIVNQVMSGLTVTYSRALRVGDYVTVGQTEGTVRHLGTLSTKIETPRGEQVTIPNAVLVTQEVMNYSRNDANTPALVPVVVTIGYDTPWRQVESMLRLAASRTQGVRTEPAPMVVQSELEDFFVRYTLFVGLDDPRQRRIVLGALRANIQDAFNEFGVQIMSPHYLGDPARPKVVPRDHWSDPPADEPVRRNK
jgi:small-conductance mechanosensitive channel